MLRLTVLSPHRDDAAFSLFISLSKWSSLPIRLQVLNFFTTSGYAPQAAAECPISISAARRQEDRSVLKRIDQNIRVIDHNFVDAPLRTGVAVTSVCDPASTALLTDELIDQLKNALQRSRADLVMAPLTLGDHMDHIAVQRAALRAFPARSLGFYEDLPYATWTSDQALKNKLEAITGVSRLPLCPVKIRQPEAAVRKCSVIQRYRSQITFNEARNIAAWSKRFHGGERIWLPLHSAKWQIRMQP